jgi:hypothetical protein
MSEVKLNLIDNQQVLYGTIHGSVADACVAVLSAEPETIAELASALTRYIKRLDDSSPFATFHSAVHSSLSSSVDTPLDIEPWDAGIVVIDLAARIVASESTYSMPQPEGEVHYHDGIKSTDITVLYRLPDDWLFVNSVEAYRWSRERRGRERLAKTPLDVREILYGAPLLDFIVNECGKIEVSEAAANGDGTVPSASSSTEDALLGELAGIHSRWLTTSREDLGGSSPRDVMLSRQDFIDFDLHTRALQWSFQGEGPPCLAKNSHAYQFAGFGTHEWVVYYDLVRDLLWSALENVRKTSVCRDRVVINEDQFVEQSADLTDTDSQPARIDSEIARLEEIKTNWLDQAQPDYDGRIPAILIDNERKRLPIALRPRDMIIDEDCPMCQMFGDETTPLGMGVGFWGLDGSHLDDDFAFSSYKTREEWEAENRRREEFDKEFNRRWEERQQRIARGETLEPDPFFDPDPFPDLELDDFSLVSSESIDDDEEEFPQ